MERIEQAGSGTSFHPAPDTVMPTVNATASTVPGLIFAFAKAVFSKSKKENR